ncbi:hypothetical protein ACS3QZ_14235 [Shimia sp. W99]
MIREKTENENPGAMCVAAGVGDELQNAHRTDPEKHITPGPIVKKSGCSGTSNSQRFPAPIEIASRSIGCALWMNTPNAWEGLQTILAARLSPACLSLLASTILCTLRRDDAIEALVRAHGGAGAPIPPLFSFMDEAVFWAQMAARDELKAYLLASYNHLPEQDQAAFLDFVQKG